MAAQQGDEGAKANIEMMFQTAQDAGFNTFRVFAHGTDYSGFVLQPEPGVYNETVFAAIDYLLDAAGRHNIRAIISPATNWERVDSKGQYVQWAGLDNGDMFWSDPTARQLFANHLSVLANRVNTVNGRAYKDDPTIFAWNLFNEPRCPEDFRSPAGCMAAMTDWMKAMSAHLKQEDPNHMVSIGMEGHFGMGSGFEGAAPYGETSSSNVLPIGQFWGALTGQDLMTQSADPNIDFLTSHLWPSGWRNLDFSWATAFLAAQQIVAARLGKPLIMEEFGATADHPELVQAQKDPWYTFVLNAVIKSQELGGPLQGALFWAWNAYNNENRTAPITKEGTIDVYTGDSTWQLLLEWSNQLAKVEQEASPIPFCLPGGASVPPPPPTLPETPVPAAETPTTGSEADAAAQAEAEALARAEAEAAAAAAEAEARARAEAEAAAAAAATEAEARAAAEAAAAEAAAAEAAAAAALGGGGDLDYLGASQADVDAAAAVATAAMQAAAQAASAAAGRSGSQVALSVAAEAQAAAAEAQTTLQTRVRSAALASARTRKPPRK